MIGCTEFVVVQNLAPGYSILLYNERYLQLNINHSRNNYLLMKIEGTDFLIYDINFILSSDSNSLLLTENSWNYPFF